MTCCGERPKTPPITPTRIMSDQPAVSRGPSGLGAHTVMIRYTRGPSVIVRGSVTGRRYAFSGGSPVQAVDSRDAASLLNTSLFRRR